MRITEATIRKLATNQVQSFAWDDELSGFGVVYARTGTKTFVARRWVRGEGKRRRVVIGHWPEMSVADARAKAEAALAEMKSGIDPRAASEAPHASGPTLRAALDYHLGKMERGENRRRKPCSPLSIEALRRDVSNHLADWLDRPLVDLTTDAIDAVLANIMATTARVTGSNPKNPPGRATANRLLAQVSAIWTSWDRRYGLALACPTKRLLPAALAPRDTRVSNDDLPAWFAKLHAKDERGLDVMSGVRRDLQLLGLFSGVRAAGLRHLRWDEIDEDEELLHIARAKGDKPYTVPMTVTLREILDRRRNDEQTAKLLAPYGGDHGYVFPSLSRSQPHKVIPVREVKERRTRRDAHGRPLHDDDGKILRENYLPGIHPLRRTYNSIAIEVGVPIEVRERLMNHAGRGVNVRHYGAPMDWSLTREWAEKIEAAIWQRIRGEVRSKRRGQLRAA